MISSFDGEYGFLSNFSFSPIEVFGVTVPTVEHAYQASKTLDLAWRDRIVAAQSPGKAKRIGKKAPIRPDWEDVKMEVMLSILRQKFAPGSKLALMLVETGLRLLEERNRWHDTVWGCCYCDIHAGEGQNLLGKLLMQVRAELASV